MAIMEGLLAGLAGQGQGRQQGYQDALAAQAQHEQFLEQQRQFNESLKLQRASAGLDTETGQPIAPVIPKQYSQILPNNKGKGTPTYDDYVKHYLGIAGANVRNPLYSSAFANIASQYGLGAERTASAAYTSGVKTDLGRAQIDLDQARVKVLTQIQPAQFKAKLGQDRDKYIYQAQAAYGRMTSNQKEREYLATLNAYYRFQGYSQQDAYRSSITQYQQEMQNYRQQTNPRNALLDPNAAQNAQLPQAPQMPNITINVGDAVRAANAALAGAGGGGTGTGGVGGGAAIDHDFSLALTADPNIDPDPVVSGVVHAMRAHPARAAQNVQALVAIGSMTQAEAQKAMMIYGRSKTQGGRSGPRIPVSAQPQARLNAALGGSQAALPFVLPQP